MRRREALKALAALPLIGAGATAHREARAQAAETSTTAAPPRAYRAAVMRSPVEVPRDGASMQATRTRNANAMVAAIEAAMRGPTPRPKLIVFPVLQLTSNRRTTNRVPITEVAVDLVSQPIDRTVFAPVAAACRYYGCYVATSTQEKVPQFPGRYFHTGIIIGPEGLVLRAPKAQARSAPEVTFLREIAEDYKKVFGPDSIMPVAETPIGRLACHVEGEAEILEASRLLAWKGAEVIVHPSAEAEHVPWPALKQALAYQCHVYLLTGTPSRYLSDGGADEWAPGASTIFGPDGKLLASIGQRGEGMAAADIDLEAVAEARRTLGRNTTPAWHLYRDLYGQ
jgi:predicted amidohydrolase